MKTKIVIMICLASQQFCWGQSFTDKITKEVSFEKKGIQNALMIANINGDVNVAGYEGDKVIVEVTRTITAKTQERLERGKKELLLGSIDRADTLIYYVEGTCNNFGKLQSKKRNWGAQGGWGYNWSESEGRGNKCNPPYDYTLDFTIKVPTSVNLILSTINNGDVTVENVKGALTVQNVNGSIKLTKISREATATTVNGDVDVEYLSNPSKDCRFYSLNGDINAWFQKGLAANMSFESFNGDFYTNVDNLESLPVTVKKEERENGTKYKVKGNLFKIGDGGVFLDFETFNGDVYLKERVN
ncbi:MAG: DUF4097 family beta strand repeat protein [Bacteroidia bacterium]|nr:DUF4097 family beta strand repeat protein [Bacteroidia bacterium]